MLVDSTCNHAEIFKLKADAKVGLPFYTPRKIEKWIMLLLPIGYGRFRLTFQKPVTFTLSYISGMTSNRRKHLFIYAEA